MQPQLGDRSLFPGLEARAYLAHAAVSPLSAPVVEAMQTAVELSAKLGMPALPELVEAADRARAAFARLVNAREEQVARLSSTSAGVTAVASALPLSAGQRLVVFTGEFPTNVTPWMAAAERAGAEVVQLPIASFQESHAAGLAALDAVLDERTALVTVSAVEFQTGLATPLAALAERAHAVGARLFVDAIQAVGAVPIDVAALDVDYLACGGHKWLMGPLGTAYLYVSDAARPELVPTQIGWMSHEEPLIYLSRPNELRYDRALFPDARAFEQGVLNFVGCAGSAAAIDLILELGPQRIFAHLQAYHDALEPRVEALGFRSLRAAEPEARSGILAFAAPEGVDLEPLVAACGERGLCVTAPDGCLRVAPHWPNALSEQPFVVETLERALAARV